MTDLPGGYLERKQRVLYSLVRAATRIALRLLIPLDQLESLLRMAYFQEARDGAGLKLDAVAALFGKSLRTVSSLHHQYRGDFFAPEREVAVRRAVAAAVDPGPVERTDLAARFPDLDPAALDAAIDDLVREGTVRATGTALARNPDAHEFLGPDLAVQVDGLNRQMDVVAEAVWHRLLSSSGRPSLARTYVFRTSDADLLALLQEVDRVARERAIAADRTAESAGGGVGGDRPPGGTRAGLTFAVAPMEDP